MSWQQDSSRQDRPIDAESADRLDRGPFVESLVRALVFDQHDAAGRRTGPRSTGYVVGLTGRWGLGKSSVLNLLAQKLGTMDDVFVASFNPWLFNGRNELIAGFFNSLRVAMGRSSAEKARALVAGVDRYRRAIELAGHGVATLADVHGTAGLATVAWRTVGTPLLSLLNARTRSPDEERHALECKIVDAECAVVVLIDELDRVEDEEVRAVAQLVKAVGDIKGISYIVAYDPERVVQALSRKGATERHDSGEAYLEKIIQHPVPLRPLFAEDAKSLFEAALEDHSIRLEESTNECEKKLLAHLIDVIETPREVKRLVGAFSILERTVRGEISAYDVLGYCWILTKSPLIRDRIADHMDELVSDPSEMVMASRIVRQMNKEDKLDIVSILGERAGIHKKLLELLFPHFTQDATQDEGRRLSKRRNLVRMLYLGNPPGMMRRDELEGFWTESNRGKLEAELRLLLRSGRLASALDRLDDLLPVLSPSGDQTFWPVLSHVLFRSTDWLEGPENAYALADDAATTLYKLALRDSKEVSRFRAAVDALIDNGDLILVPWILRKHLFAHGLTRHSESPRGGEVFDKDETQALLAKELPRYRRAVLDGTALKRLPNLEAIYVLVNSGQWDAELRVALTEQLDSMPAILTLAGLMVPPDHSVEKASVDQLFDIASVQRRIDACVAEGKRPTDLWLNQCLDRLRAVLSGLNPAFGDSEADVVR